ncbi:MAG: D-alanine--D-alanine ligase [bacterium]|nr:D-alanine--D-alanine ligase [bacterium]
MADKLNVAIVFGGKSGEHEVSLMSAKSVIEAIDKTKYKITLIGIDKIGVWHIGDQTSLLLNQDNIETITLNTHTPIITIFSTGKEVYLVDHTSNTKLTTIDVFFPLTHGTFGEDGCIQGMIELTGAAYVGAGVLGSSICMDKDVMKRLLRDSNLPIANFLVLKSHTYRDAPLDQIIATLSLPIFVKPVNLGSSVGITKAHTKEELEKAIEIAFIYDNKVILEENIISRELEVSVLGNDEPKASLPGEIVPHQEFYSYEAKYNEGGSDIIIPAKLSDLQIKHLQKLALDTYQTLECVGLARVDFFMTSEGEFFINELNTLPGFTKTSVYPMLWEASGISYQKLIDMLIDLAQSEKHKKANLIRNYLS